MAHVQYSDSTHVKIVAVFADPQDADAYPNQAEVADDDPLLLAFLHPSSLGRSVDARQLRQALTATGWRAAVEAAVAVADQDTKDWYEFETEIRENHPVVIQMMNAIGAVDADRIAVFDLAVTL